MRKRCIQSLLLTLFLSNFALADKVIGILVPLALPAMDQIVSGYETQLQKTYPGKIQFLLKNAQGNTQIQQSILQEFLDQNVDVIAPIGTDATEMTAHMDKKNIPIVAIAAERPKGLDKNANLTNILDEVSVLTQVNFIHQAFPNLKKMTVIYSADDRILADIKPLQTAATQVGINVQGLMVQQASDLYTVRSHIDADSQAIFILKDELVVSGIQTLAKEANSRKILLIASDDGSVSGGAALAFGVKESDIGIDSAASTLKILNGSKASDVPGFSMTQYTVFVNPSAAKIQGVNLADIQKISQKQGLSYDVITD